eukprot:gene4889-8696_t
MHNFGMPRVGDIAFARLFNQTILYSTRVVHEKDIVPQFPSQELGFHHVAREIWNRSPETASPPKDQTYIVCDNSGEDPSCSNGLPIEDLRPEDHDYYMGSKNEVCHYDKHDSDFHLPGQSVR